MSRVIPDCHNADGTFVKTKKILGKDHHTRSYSLWRNMLSRCEGKTLQNRPTYTGCSVSEEFKDFQTFAGWCSAQIGFNVDGYQLDKDILVHNNKVYGPETCVFVPQALNTLFCASDSIRGALPQGVTWDAKNNKYRVKVKSGGVTKHVGRYSDSESAKLAYKFAKESEAKLWAATLKDENYVIDLRVIDTLSNWTFYEKT